MTSIRVFITIIITKIWLLSLTLVLLILLILLLLITVNKLAEENFVCNDDGFQRFCEISSVTLYNLAPGKIKHVRGSQMPFSKKELSKEILKRTKLPKWFPTKKR